MKNSIKRAQSQASSSFAERENFRPKVKLKKLSLTLAALLSMTAGAWALPENDVTVTPVTGKTNQWTFTMPAGNVELTPIYAPEFTAAFKAGNDLTIQGGKATVTVTESGATTGTDVTLDADGKLTPLYEGQTITMTAAPGYKFRTVEVKKSAAPRPLAEATAEDLGKIAGADGNIYDTKAAAEAANTTAVAMIAYVGSASDCTHGLAIALADESGTKTWSAAGAACSGKTAVTGGTWRLPSIKDWQYMFIGCGASGSYSDSPSTMSYSELATKLTTANGTALQTVSYWSSTESSPGEDAWSLYFGGSSASFFSGDYEGDAYPIRACLVF